MEKQWKSQIDSVANPEKAKILSRFFKSAPGEYGEGQKFIGCTVPQLRSIAKDFYTAPLRDYEYMMTSDIHEYRLSAFLALVERYAKAKNEQERIEIADFYINHAHSANNWDIVDLSAPKIIGEHIYANHETRILDNFSRSENIWLRRIAIVSTYTLIKHNHYSDTLRLAIRYLSDTHPLIHKATGWMLREIGKRNQQILTGFLDCHAPEMPRTALRYAIERLSPDLRKKYLNLKSSPS